MNYPQSMCQPSGTTADIGWNAKKLGRPTAPEHALTIERRWAVWVWLDQCFLECSRPSVDAESVLARFAARFSLRDLPDFLVMLCRGDLSDMTGPLVRGPGWSQLPDHTRIADGRAMLVADAVWHSCAPTPKLMVTFTQVAETPLPYSYGLGILWLSMILLLMRG